MQSTPKSLRCHIGLFGRRNVGKSSLLNALTRQNVSIVSATAGTTTDPVEKPMELLPLGPVLFIDTAGIDDVGALGELRIRSTRQAMERTDVAVLVVEGDRFADFEERLLAEFAALKTPVITVFNKTDLHAPPPELCERLASRSIPTVATNAPRGDGIDVLRQALFDAVPDDVINDPPLLADLVQAGELVVLVIPIDKEAPKGRLILPQVQTLRELLDNDAFSMVVKDRELQAALSRLTAPPSLVVTDSQAFLKVAADTPPGVRMTSFSILFARKQGDLPELVRGAMTIDALKPGDKVLIAEACTHHPIAEDIGRVKIPRWLTQYVGGKLDIEVTQGRDFPDDLPDFRLVVHCGSCMFNRRQMLTRILRCREAGVPITNYGLTIAYTLGIFARALEPFPVAQSVYQEATRGATPRRAPPQAG